MHIGAWNRFGVPAFCSSRMLACWKVLLWCVFVTPVSADIQRYQGDLQARAARWRDAPEDQRKRGAAKAANPHDVEHSLWTALLPLWALTPQAF